jgi:hypothetical protein
MKRLAVLSFSLLFIVGFVVADDPGKGELSVANSGGPESTGGPDGFGYQYIDNNEVTGLPPAYSLVDISGTGAALGPSDDGEANITIPFGFPFYGVTYTDIRVGNNGGLLMGATTGDVLAGNACPLPSTSGSTAPRISVFWDDIDSDSGDVFWQAFASCPHPDCSGQCAVIEWYNRPHFSNTGDGTFEVVLCDSGDIIFQYTDVVFGDPANMDDGVSASVGIEDELQDGTYFLEYSCNQAVITDGLAIKFTTGPIPVELQSFDVD